MPAQMESMILPPRLPLVISTANRDGEFLKDSRLVNCYAETSQSGELWVYKRPGISLWSTSPPGTGLGAFHWQGAAYFILNGTLYKNGVTVPGSLDTTGGTYRFSSILGATPKLVFGNGVKTYAYDGVNISADLHTIDVDFPLFTVKGIVYLNGATYVMTFNGEIWGSKVNSVDVAGDWTALSFIAAQIEPDDGVYLAKQLVYAIALNTWSTEVFFDAGNPTGSPLGPVQGSKISYGCASAESVQEIDDRLFWISSTKSAAVQVSMMDQLNHQIVSTKPVDRLLQTSDLLDENVASLQIKLNGHSFYILTLRDINVTLVYDIAEGEWHQWTDANGNYFPMMAYTYNNTNQHIFLHESNGLAYYAGVDYTNDAGNPIVVDIYTPNFDANTSRRKQLSLMKILADKQSGSQLYIRCSDDDYETWSNFRVADLSQKQPSLTNCGTFTKRAYHFRHRSDTKFRMQAVDVQYDLGTL
jgi:hypothetical protein